jgi:hypothetical protein
MTIAEVRGQIAEVKIPLIADAVCAMGFYFCNLPSDL